MRPDSPPGSPGQPGPSTEAFPLAGAKDDDADDGEGGIVHRGGAADDNSEKKGAIVPENGPRLAPHSYTISGGRTIWHFGKNQMIMKTYLLDAMAVGVKGGLPTVASGPRCRYR